MKAIPKTLRSTIGLWSMVTFLGLAIAADYATAAPGFPGSSKDPSSASNVDSFTPQHMELDYLVDFDTSTTFGTVTHTIKTLENNVTTVFMDVWDNVEVSRVAFWTALPVPNLVNDDPLVVGVGQNNWVNYYTERNPLSVPHNISTAKNEAGKALGITIPNLPAGTTFYIRLAFRSLPESRALTWLAPNETEAGKKPFVYSLCEMIKGRDWIPMFDTPSSKITYNATVTTPSEYVVHMGGNQTGEFPHNATWTSRTFESTLKIPTYQISLVAGDLKAVDLGGRVKVFAEAPLIETAAEQFKDLPSILELTEKYLTPYQWGNSINFFVMPPGYVFGGMEHINTIQLSMETLKGEGSMKYVAIHEITHSWFGNEVGCKNWNHFWINEGMNTFAEREIQAQFYGEDGAKKEYWAGNHSVYTGEMSLLFGLDSPYSSLFPNIGDKNPEKTISRVSYEKGAQFMYHIESLLGKDQMQVMLRSYLSHFSQQAIDEDEMKIWYDNWVMETFPGQAGRDIIVKTMWDQWVYQPGNGPVTIDVKTSSMQDAEDLAMEYLALVNGTGTGTTPLHFSDYLGFDNVDRLVFVLKLKSEGTITKELMQQIDADLAIIDEIKFPMDFTTEPEYINEWFNLGYDLGYRPLLDMFCEWGLTEYCGSSSSSAATTTTTKAAKKIFFDRRLLSAAATTKPDTRSNLY